MPERRPQATFGRALRRLPRFLRAAVLRYRFARILRDHRRRRRREIAAELVSALPGCVLIAGDSHAELIGHPDYGSSVVNMGIGGIRAGDYAADLARLPDPPRARLAILLIGTNDTARSIGPGRKRRVQAFDAAVLRILSWLRTHSDAVLVGAIPPIRPTVADLHDLGAMQLYNRRLGDLCRSAGCRFVDPFAEVRADDPGLLRSDVPSDPGGVHLADYGVAVRAIAKAGAAVTVPA